MTAAGAARGVPRPAGDHGGVRVQRSRGVGDKRHWIGSTPPPTSTKRRLQGGRGEARARAGGVISQQAGPLVSSESATTTLVTSGTGHHGRVVVEHMRLERPPLSGPSHPTVEIRGRGPGSPRCEPLRVRRTRKSFRTMLSAPELPELPETSRARPRAGGRGCLPSCRRRSDPPRTNTTAAAGARAAGSSDAATPSRWGRGGPASSRWRRARRPARCLRPRCGR